jgi:hypothetical protein
MKLPMHMSADPGGGVTQMDVYLIVQEAYLMV